jgi:hypothetical protein
MKLARPFHVEQRPGAWALSVLASLTISVSLTISPLATASTTTTASTAATDSDDLLHESLAQRWLERNDAASDHPGGWQALMEERFAHLAVGLFELRIPCAALRDSAGAKQSARAVQALLECQVGWFAWARGEVGVKTEKSAKEDPVSKWLAGWSAKTFAGLAPGADLAELGSVPAAVREALARLRSEMRQGAPLGIAGELAGVRLALFPQRSEFVEFVSVAGRLDQHLTATAWNPGLNTWLEYSAQDTRFLCLEYGSDTAGCPIAAGESVTDRNPLALAELVAQVATRVLLVRLYAGQLDPALASSMANALVIELYGELDTRIDGDVRSRSVEGRSVFVPGGNPDGGFLPASSAENRWRGTKGRDHFVGVLAQAQKASGKKAETRPGRLTRFELFSDDGSRKEIVSAPFLGPNAAKPAEVVLADYLELVRCYGVAFLHWLRASGAGERAASAQRFGEFLRALGRSGKAEDLPRTLQELYGRPLSASSPDELFAQDTLEGDFLAWLSKQG